MERSEANSTAFKASTMPIKQRCRFKIATLAFRHFEGTLPKYLSDTLVTRNPPRLVRSSSVRRLHPPKKPKRKTVGGRSFAQTAPLVWNSLPADIKASVSLTQFRSRIKTHLFREYFDTWVCWNSFKYLSERCYSWDLPVSWVDISVTLWTICAILFHIFWLLSLCLFVAVMWMLALFVLYNVSYMCLCNEPSFDLSCAHKNYI